MARIGFIGLGVMGFPMACHLAQAGHDVTVYNRTRERAEEWVRRHGGSLADTPAATVRDCEFAITCVARDEDLRAVTLGPDGAFSALAPDSVFIDHTTASAAVARELHAEAQKHGFAALDAPVSGGQMGAENGVLSVMVGGDAEPFERAEPIIAAYARICRLLGPAGAGQLTKMVNQICIAGLVQGLAEAVAFAQAAGLDTDAALAAVSKGAAQSWQMDNRWKTMAEGRFDFGFAVDWMRKDLGLVLDEARANGSSVAVTALVDQFYAEVQAMGGARWDTSSLAARLQR
jgi:3-hydroxyisobutyrate dehydrogenase